MTIGKESDEEDNYEFHNTLHSEEGGFKSMGDRVRYFLDKDPVAIKNKLAVNPL